MEKYEKEREQRILNGEIEDDTHYEEDEEDQLIF